MTLIELSDKAVDAIRGRAQVMSDPFWEEQDNAQAAKVLAALDKRTDYGSVDFDDESLAWLEKNGQEMRPDIEGRATGLIYEGDLEIDWEGSTGETHYVWAVEDMVARLARGAAIKRGEDPEAVERFEPEPVDGWKDIENLADITAELDRMETWWQVIEGPPADHPAWAMGDELYDFLESVAGLRGKVLELIAAGKIDPAAASKAALEDRAERAVA